jgi:hypothetical protein
MKNFFYFILVVVVIVAGYYGWKTYGNIKEKLDRFEYIDSIATAAQQQDSLKSVYMDSLTSSKVMDVNNAVQHDTTFTMANGHVYSIIKGHLIDDPECPKCKEIFNAQMQALFDAHLQKEKEMVESMLKPK